MMRTYECRGSARHGPELVSSLVGAAAGTGVPYKVRAASIGVGTGRAWVRVLVNWFVARTTVRLSAGPKSCPSSPPPSPGSCALHLCHGAQCADDKDPLASHVRNICCAQRDLATSGKYSPGESAARRASTNGRPWIGQGAGINDVSRARISVVVGVVGRAWLPRGVPTYSSRRSWKS